MNQIINDLWEHLTGYYESLIAILPKLGIAIIAFLFFLFIAKRAQAIVTSKLGNRMDDPLLARFLGRVVKMVFIIIALMVVMKIVGLADVAAGLLAGASVSAVVFGFAFKDIAENFLAGIMLAFNRPFRVGDTVELDGNKGKVVTLNMRTSHIKTFDGKDIYIPNANVIKNPVINYTIDGFMRQEFNIGLDYGSDVDGAIDIVEKEMDTVEGVLKGDRAPSVSIGSLSASTLDLKVQYWLDTFDTTFPARNIRTSAINKSLVALDKAGYYMPGDVVELKNYQEKEIKTGTTNKADAAA